METFMGRFWYADCARPKLQTVRELYVEYRHLYYQIEPEISRGARRVTGHFGEDIFLDPASNIEHQKIVSLYKFYESQMRLLKLPIYVDIKPEYVKPEVKTDEKVKKAKK